MMQKMHESVALARKEMPAYFSEKRVTAMRAAFEEMDADGGLTLDMEELCPFFDYVFYKLFSENLTQREQEQLKQASGQQALVRQLCHSIQLALHLRCSRCPPQPCATCYGND